MYKVIYHIDEREKWSLTLGNVTNMIVYYQAHHIDYQSHNLEVVFIFNQKILIILIKRG